MSLHGPDLPPHPTKLPPMSDGEYRDARRGLLLQWITGIIFAGAAVVGSATGYLPIFGLVPSAIAGLFFGIVLGNKFFPDAGKFYTVRCRNYRRQRAGKPLLDEDDPRSEFFSDFNRG